MTALHHSPPPFLISTHLQLPVPSHFNKHQNRIICNLCCLQSYVSQCSNRPGQRLTHLSVSQVWLSLLQCCWQMVFVFFSFFFLVSFLPQTEYKIVSLHLTCRKAVLVHTFTGLIIIPFSSYCIVSVYSSRFVESLALSCSSSPFLKLIFLS